MTDFLGTATAADEPVGKPELLTHCPVCAKQISRAATACPACGHPLQPTPAPAAAPSRLPPAPPTSGPQVSRTWNPGIAALLSFFFPGAGQIYRGKIGAGILWLIAVLIGYMALVIPGIILHLICIYNAATE